MIKIGVLLNNLGGSQLAFHFIKNANAALFGSISLDIVAFCEQIEKPCIEPQFARMPIQEAYGYDGVLVATSLDYAQKISWFPSAKLRIFYAQDLEWIRYPARNYSPFENVYRNPNLTLATRCISHKNVIENCWNVPVAKVIENFNFAELLELINEKI